MSKLLLIRNAAPEKDSRRPSHLWKLSEEGKASIVPLASAIRVHGPELVVSSDEPKGVETAELLAAELRLPHEVVSGLHEHDRTNVPHLRTHEFISSMALFFSKPTLKVFGSESATSVLQRVEESLREVVADHAGKTVAVVSHAAAIAVFAAAHSDVNGFQLWRSMKAPSYLVFDADTLRLLERVDQLPGL
jgi:broad specificity phosphatase PhoE